MVGVVFVDRSPRYVTVEQAKIVVSQLSELVEPVGLFVDAEVDQVHQVAGQVGLSVVQLHGHETAADVAALAPLRVIKAVAFDAQSAEAVLGPWREAAPSLSNLSAILFDAPVQQSPQSLPGGSGNTFDWSALAEARARGLLEGLPDVFLAGGLDPGNVGDAIDKAHPYAVDVSSGVERSRGVKDIDLIRAFCQAVHAADR